MILGITNDIPDYDNDYDMHRLLGTLFSNKLNVDEKLSIIKQEYDIYTGDEIREDVNVMCNLGEGIEERAIERTKKAVTKDVTEGIAMNMYTKGYTFAQIAESTNLNIEDVKAIVNKKSFN